MPPATRSKKIVFLEDQTSTASQIAIPNISSTAGTPLAEITNSGGENEIVERMTVEDVEMVDQLKNLKAAYKSAIGLKKNKKNRNKKREKLQLKQDLQNPPEIVDDEQPAVVSPASEEARQILSSDDDGTQSIEEEHASPPSPAVRETRQLVKPQAGQFDYLHSSTTAASPVPVEQRIEYIETCCITDTFSPRAKTRRGLDYCFLPGKYRADMSELLAELTAAEELKQSSEKFADMIPGPTKSKMATLEEIEKAYGQKDTAAPKKSDTDDDSFIDKITERSPAKPVSRIENSIEELDKLEDTIEALGQAIFANPIPSPERKKTPTRAPTISRGQTTSLTGKVKNTLKIEKNGANRTAAATSSVKPRERRVSEKVTASPSKAANRLGPNSNASLEVSATGKPEDKSTANRTKRPSSLVQKEPIKSAKPVTLPNFELPGEAVARRLKEKREARQARSQGQDLPLTKTARLTTPKVKSTKSPTKSAFELPGEALSRKKREAHESRLKAQEEEERKRREFKAKPLRKSVAPDFVPRDTAASLARKNQGVSQENAIAATGLPYSNLSLKVAKRGSIVGAHRPSILATNIANTSAPRSPGPSANNSSANPSTGGHATTQRSVSASEVQTQRQRAKEIYNRDTKALEDLEKDRREREAAAKRSRDEAAERGRQASREWAEKQRAKKAMQVDKGLV